MSAHEAVLARTNELFELFNKGDRDSMVGLYRENAILYLDNHKPIVGRAGIKASMDKLDNIKTMLMESDEYFEEFNDTTAYSLAITKCQDASGKIVGRYKGVMLWRKIDGQWFIEHDIFNSMPN